MRGWVGLVCVAIAACGPGEDEPGAVPGIPTLIAREDLRIDGYAHDLVPINWLGVSSDGRIALLQWQDYQVRFFDAEGTDLGAVGREGDGPGEFRRPVRAGWIVDSLWVSDTQLGRAVVISPDLEAVRTVRNHDAARPAPDDTSGTASYLLPSPFAMYGDGESLAWAIRREDGPPEIPDEGTPLLRLARDGTIRHVVTMVPSSEGTSVTVDLGGGAVSFSQIPFVARSYWIVSADGGRFAHLSTDITALPEPTYRVLVKDAAGTEVFDRTYPFAAVPIPGTLMDSAIAAAATRNGARSEEAESKLQAAAPEIYSEAQRLVVGMDGRIWIGMRARPDGRRWRVLSPAGDPVADVMVPQSVTLWAADEVHAWGVMRDDLDVESVVRYRIDEERQ